MEDKLMLLVDLKVEIGLLKQTLQESEKSFAKNQQAHKSLMKKLAGNINKLEAVAVYLEEVSSNGY